MSEITLFKRWTVKKKHFWWGIGLGIPALCILSFLAVFAFSARIGGMGAADTFINEGYYGLSSPQMESFDDGYFEEEMAMDQATSGGTSFDTNTVANTTGPATIERLIIREGNITVAVEDTLGSREAISDLVAELALDGAYVVTSSESGRGDNRQPYVSMVIRVPVESFDRVMDQIAKMSVRVDERWENAQDVTDEYVDVAGRIEAAEISIERLKELMRDAEFTEDLLYAEEQLSRREAELEALKGRMNYLADSAALSRINISLNPYELSQPLDTSWKPAETFRRATENLIEGMQNFADFLIMFAVSVLPFLLIFGLLIWGVVAIVRRRRAKKQATQVE